ncbi:MAG: Structural maintenance of chromosomes protein 5 [Candelina submexicana]|nr:MAG: Structural maintenance of chromosomes protein 5 [Candelina submexicana]
MPHRRRKTPEPEDDNDDSSSSGATASSHRFGLNKRARININGDASPRSSSPLLPDGYLAKPNTSTKNGGSGARREVEKHQPGSIVRVKLTNFVTYTSAEFFPGPSLNMVIGPNGTGKSTLVCAICLGMGWGTQQLGRAKDVSEFVKHGCQEASIEIELAADPERHTANPVIRRNIKREGNKSQFFIAGKVATQKLVLDLARSFSIQIDNLCQFLPQDKVCEFAALSPVELLHSTQQAAAPAEMIEWHSNLKDLRREQKVVQAHLAGGKENLASLESRHQMQRADVERLKERAAIQERLRLLQKARPFAKYREARNRHTEAKKTKKNAQAALKELEKEVEPSLRAVNAKEEYLKLVNEAVKDRKRAVDRAEATADNLVTKQRGMDDKLKDLDMSLDAEKNGDKTRKRDLGRVEAIMTSYKRQMDVEPVEIDVASYNEHRREKERAMAELRMKRDAVKESENTIGNRVRDNTEKIERARIELDSLESQAGQQGNKLRQISRDTAIAWDWIQNHQDMFEKQVYGPPIMECSVNDQNYVDAIEGLFQNNDLLAFTCQTRNDFKTLQQQLYGAMKLGEIVLHTVSSGLERFKPPASEAEMRRYGFEGWAIDYISGPEPVLAMLCGESRLNQTGVVLRDISDQQYSALEDSPISSWVTGKQSYQITRRREYGPGATSTRVRNLKKAYVWTTQTVDPSAKRDLQDNIRGWNDEINDLKQQANDVKLQLQALGNEFNDLKTEKERLESEKADKQKANAELRALPTKLEQQEEKLAQLKIAGEAVRERIEQIEEEKDNLVLEKGQVALDYADAVGVFRQAHMELLQAEHVLIEATSDVQVLQERKGAVKEMLEAKRREVTQIERDFASLNNTAKELLLQCRKLLEEAEGTIVNDFYSSLPEGQTSDELETEIESEKARLELVHEGNPHALQEYEARQIKIDKLQEKVQAAESKLEDFASSINEIRELWEPRLDELVKKISDAFSISFEQIGCAGQVDVYKDEDFDQWAIQIQVKFREHEQLSILDSHRQSGGERAVSTIFYLMALQSLARAPFRVVDEINQGMDPRNERMVHERMVNIACQENTSQYFLITPKLLHDLKYHPRMTIQCIASGEYMPKNYQDLDFGRCVDIMRRVKAAG